MWRIVFWSFTMFFGGRREPDYTGAPRDLWTTFGTIGAQDVWRMVGWV